MPIDRGDPNPFVTCQLRNDGNTPLTALRPDCDICNFEVVDEEGEIVPPRHRVHDNNDYRLDEANLCLAERLKEEGFTTAGIAGA